MKGITANLSTHLASAAATLAVCVKITRVDTQVFAFTSHVENLVVDGTTYIAAQGSFSPQMVKTSSDMAVDNLDMEAIIDSSYITESDLMGGKYDYATVEFFIVNYMSVGDGIVKLRKGTLGEIESSGYKFKAELRGLMQAYQQVIGHLYGKRCDADLGDTRCTVNKATYTVTGTVSSVTSKEQFVGSSVPTRRGGLLTWTSGLNNGLKMEVKSLSGSTVVLNLPMPYTIQAGDSYSVYSGCDKLLETCRDVFNNVVNFRGFPYIPGPDRAMQYPDAK